MNGLDEIDWKLLDLLQEDARLGYRELARRVDLAPATVGTRVRRLERLGVIDGYHARVVPSRAGYAASAFIVVNTGGRRQSLRVADAAGRSPAILEDHRVTGTDDHILKVVAPTLESLEPLIDGLNEAGKLATMLVLSSPKAWSPVVRPSDVTMEL